MPYEIKEIMEIRVTKDFLHEYFRNLIPEIDANDIIVGLTDDPFDSSRYMLTVEKVA